MKPISEIRNQMKLKPSDMASRLSYLKKQKIDFNVFLPSIGKNLQRDFVWDLIQKQEIVMSVIIGRHVPHLAIINRYDDTYEIIDGKQRLSSLFEYLDGAFPIVIDGIEYYYNDLDEDYKLEIKCSNIKYYIVYEENQNAISDLDRINWFKFINFAGTKQDYEHLNSLK